MHSITPHMLYPKEGYITLTRWTFMLLQLQYMHTHLCPMNWSICLSIYCYVYANVRVLSHASCVTNWGHILPTALGVVIIVPVWLNWIIF